MQVVVCGASKGGVGKTTIAAALGVEAARRGRKVVLVDLDPQRSLTRWHAHRVHGSPTLAKPDRVIARTLDRLRWEGCELVIVDTPPVMVGIIEPAVAVADLVLIPIRASPLDVQSLDVIMDMVEAHARRFAFVLNATMPGSKLAAGVRRYLKKGGDVLDVELPNRLVYASAMITGESAAEVEPDGTAARETAQLLDAVERRLARTQKPARSGRR